MKHKTMTACSKRGTQIFKFNIAIRTTINLTFLPPEKKIRRQIKYSNEENK